MNKALASLCLSGLPGLYCVGALHPSVNERTEQTNNILPVQCSESLKPGLASAMTSTTFNNWQFRPNK